MLNAAGRMRRRGPSEARVGDGRFYSGVERAAAPW